MSYIPKGSKVFKYKKSLKDIQYRIRIIIILGVIYMCDEINLVDITLILE